MTTNSDRFASNRLGARGLLGALVTFTAICTSCEASPGGGRPEDHRSGDISISHSVDARGKITSTVTGPGGGDPLVTLGYDPTMNVVTYTLAGRPTVTFPNPYPSGSVEGADMLAELLYRNTSGYHDDPGCDVIGNYGVNGVCSSKACAVHDSCYLANGCSWSSWGTTVAQWNPLTGWLIPRSLCDRCNHSAAGSMLYYGARGCSGDCQNWGCGCEQRTCFQNGRDVCSNDCHSLRNGPGDAAATDPSSAGSCGNGSCDNGEDCQTCPSDCPTCGVGGIDCGNGSCDESETCTSCTQDCGAECGADGGGSDTNPCQGGACYCGDGSCNDGETCGQCPNDCGECPDGGTGAGGAAGAGGSSGGTVCGDGSCDADESCSGCESDCGACGSGGSGSGGSGSGGSGSGGSPGGTCGDGSCDAGEDCSSCESDCGACAAGYCGDGSCDGGEDCSGCPSDCGEC